MKSDRKHRTELGLIAQDAEPLYPELVQTGPDGMKSMAYAGLIAPLIKAMQEQQAIIEQQQAEINDLKARLDLKPEIDELKAQNCALATSLNASPAGSAGRPGLL
jgi:hypothetical protein